MPDRAALMSASHAAPCTPPRFIDDDVAGAVDAAVGLLPREVSA